MPHIRQPGDKGATPALIKLTEDHDHRMRAWLAKHYRNSAIKVPLPY